MKNKALAVFGIATYLLSVYASATNPQGESAVPNYIIIISGIASFLYAIFATIRLWKISKFVSVLFAVTSLTFFCFEVMQLALSPSDGTTLILVINIAKIINLLTFFYSVFLLWRTPNEITNESY